MFDFIGDIHGHADKLEDLLLKLGYVKKSGSFVHPNRKVFFLGDYIDRGPKIKETLSLVKAMVDNGDALAIMGNHEYNAICFHLQDNKGGHLRKHKIRNIIQHYETIKQFQNRQKEYENYLEWFLTLPLFYETQEYRAVHACWDSKSIQLLSERLINGKLSIELIREAVIEGTNLYDAVEMTLKGKEIIMPDNLYFEDKEGTKRHKIRIKWWEDPSQMTYKSISVTDIPHLPERPLEVHEFFDFYQSNTKVFFGHYWLSGEPEFFKKNICCLDYSVAKGGNLVCYRLGDEEHLNIENIVYV